MCVCCVWGIEPTGHLWCACGGVSHACVVRVVCAHGGCVWCGVCMVCSCCVCPVYVHGGSEAARRAGPCWWQQLRCPGWGLHPESPARTPTRTCRVAAQKLRCRNSILIWTPTAAAERGGGRRREGERGVGSQPKGGGASAEGWGHLAAWAWGARGSVSPEPTTPENTPRCDDEVKEPGARGGCPGRWSHFPAETQVGVQGSVGVIPLHQPTQGPM